MLFTSALGTIRLSHVLHRVGPANFNCGWVRYNSAGYTKVTIDGITKTIGPVENPEFVPRKFCEYILIYVYIYTIYI